MKKSEVKVGETVLLPVMTEISVTIIQQVNACRTLVRLPNGKEVIVPTGKLRYV